MSRGKRAKQDYGMLNTPMRLSYCRQCGKGFVLWTTKDLWGWFVREQGQKRLFCGYSCMRKYEKLKEQKRKQQKRSSMKKGAGNSAKKTGTAG